MTVPTATNYTINFNVLGDAKIIALHNGDPNSHLPSNNGTSSFDTFNGLVRAYVQAGRTVGAIEIEGSCKGLKSNSVKVEIQSGDFDVKSKRKFLT